MTDSHVVAVKLLTLEQDPQIQRTRKILLILLAVRLLSSNSILILIQYFTE